MKCPICEDVRMREVEKDGVLIDVCPDCKGVWLDRGELDKLMKGVREMRQELEEWEQQPPVQPGYAMPPQGGVGTPPPQPGYGNQPGYGHPPANQGQYGTPPANYGSYDNRGYDQRTHNQGQYGYDKRGYPYKKKKKTVLDVFGDLFD
ncbi:TFIIB-type zinc ribbon-containing protein [Paenibacillus abyssi]|uniref:Transcription factor zinc-finger domain-containing protein n=1 Tax=Paenibacillus abyssi TaxID=1340531 RepID=A0A917G492_9BACL|nr:hypothetical protein GCM10010916_43320 [Paenibacillus abyssi]